jgi:uncharacterized protein (DUF169 family)
MQKWIDLGNKLDSILRLWSSPIAIKLLESEGGIPEKAVKISSLRKEGSQFDKFTVCQLPGLVRFHYALQGKMIVATKEDIVCAMGAANLGFYELPEDMKSGDRGLNIYSESKEAVKKMMEDIIRIEPGKFSAIVVSKLQKITVDPDIVLVYCNSTQALRLVYGATWKAGEKVEMSTNGHCGVCGEAIAATYVLNKPRLALPCEGAHKWGLTRDDEIIMAIPESRVEEIVKGIERSQEQEYGIFGPDGVNKIHGLTTPARRHLMSLLPSWKIRELEKWRDK